MIEQESIRGASIPLHVVHFRQCDPRKCSALKLGRFNLIKLHRSLRTIPHKAILLNPFAEYALSPADTQSAQHWGLVVLDCSWSIADQMLKRLPMSRGRCLPYLIASNPVNYGAIGKLSSVEALAAALYIFGKATQAERLLSLFKWGHTFQELNGEALSEYQSARDSTEVVAIQRTFLDSLKRKKE